MNTYDYGANPFVTNLKNDVFLIITFVPPDGQELTSNSL